MATSRGGKNATASTAREERGERREPNGERGGSGVKPKLERKKEMYGNNLERVEEESLVKRQNLDVGGEETSRAPAKAQTHPSTLLNASGDCRRYHTVIGLQPQA